MSGPRRSFKEFFRSLLEAEWPRACSFCIARKSLPVSKSRLDEEWLHRQAEGKIFMQTNIKRAVWILALAGSMTTAAFAADREIKVDDRLDASAETLTDMMKASDQGIPRDLIDKAHCVVVVPGMKKAGFIFGGKYGRGFAVCRRHDGVGWSAPAAMRVEGGASDFRSARRTRMLCCW